MQIVALLLPFFNDIVALLGAIGFAPLTIFFPVSRPLLALSLTLAILLGYLIHLVHHIAMIVPNSSKVV